MNTKIKIIILLSFVILLATNTQANQTQELNVNDEIVSFTLLTESFCGYTENVFRIQRPAYEQGIAPLNLLYNFTVYETDQNKTTKTIEKTINKYSSTKTGVLNSSKQTTYHLEVRAHQQELFWIVQGNCTSQQTSINSTQPPINTTNNTITNTSFRDELNSTENQTGNMSTHSANATSIEEINQTIHNQTTEETPDCLSFTEIYTNANTYHPPEQMTMQFFLRPLTQTFSITYWIEDLQGTIVKKNITTTNVHEKSYTFKPITQPEKVYKIKAVFQDTCGMQEKEKLIVVTSSPSAEEEIDIKSSEQLIIESITSKDTTISATIFAQKSQTTKTMISCKQLTQENKQVQEEIKWYLLSKQQQMRIKLPLTMTDLPSRLVCEGLGELVMQDINYTTNHPHACPEIVHTYTRNQYVSPNATWYVRIQGKGDINVHINVNNKTVKEQRVNVQGEATVPIPISLEENKSIVRTRITQQECRQEKEDILLLKTKNLPTKTTTEKQKLPLEQLFRNTTTTPAPNSFTSHVITSEKNKTTSSVMYAVALILALVSLGLATRYLMTKRLKKQGKKDQ